MPTYLIKLEQCNFVLALFQSYFSPHASAALHVNSFIAHAIKQFISAFNTRYINVSYRHKQLANSGKNFHYDHE